MLHEGRSSDRFSDAKAVINAIKDDEDQKILPIILDICKLSKLLLMLNFVLFLKLLMGHPIFWLGLVLISMVILFDLDPSKLWLTSKVDCL